MVWLGRLFQLDPAETSGASARAYMPGLMVMRGLAFVRTLVVAGMLGEAGQREFGLYQPALEWINLLVVLVLFGASDVAERYVSRVQRELGAAGLRQWLLRQWLRVGLIGLLVLGAMAGAAPWLSRMVWGEDSRGLVVACGAAVMMLAMFAHVSATLRGLRFYSAAAGMEVTSGLLLLMLSVVAALLHDARWLVAAYAISVMLPMVFYAALLLRHLSGQSPAAPAGTPPSYAHMTRFAAWTLIRLLLVTLFSFLTLWGVGYLAEGPDHSQTHGQIETSQFSMPYRIAQLIAFTAITAWSSSYAIAATAWSHGRLKRARVQWFRVGRFGMAAVTLLAVIVLICRGVLAWILPVYAAAIDVLVPGMLAFFLWYGLVGFMSTYSDLLETPWRGAAIWACALAVQVAGIAWAAISQMSFNSEGIDVKAYMLIISAAGLVTALLTAAPMLCRPMRFSATGIPVVLLAIVPVTLFSPSWVVDWIAAPVMLAAVLFLYTAGLLVRPMDRRAWRRWRAGTRLSISPPRQL